MSITGSGKTPETATSYVAPELVRSIGQARILDLVCEGPIVGLVDGDSSVYIDGTPLKDPKSGKYNFLRKDGTPAVFADASHVGTPDQGYIPGFSQIESEIAVGATVLNGQPVTRRIEPGIDRIRLRLATPALYKIDGQGNTQANEVQYHIEVKDSTMTDFPPPAETSQALSPVPVNINLSNVVGLTGYDLVLEADLAAAASDTQVLNRLHYAFFLDGGLAITLEVYGYSESEGWHLLQSGQYFSRGATVHVPAAEMLKIDIADVVSVYGMTKLQFRFLGTPGVKLTSNLPTNTPGSAVALRGEYSIQRGAYTALTGPPFTGNHPTKYEISTYDYPLPGVGPWDIRVTKITEDSQDAKKQQTLQWESYTEIVDRKLSYPDCAVFAVTASAEQFSSIPTRGYRCKLLIVQVPSNCFPASYDYRTNRWTQARYTRNAMGEDTGVEQGWDGTFYAAHTHNPAWCYYNMLLHPRYGLGRYLRPANVDKWTLYTIGRYCDGMVPTGYKDESGADVLEPRFALNCYITSQSQAYALLQNLTSVFRGMVYWSAGKVTAMQDSPAEPVLEYTNASVENGQFSYSGTAKRARHNAALVAWNDPALLYQRVVEYVDDPEGIRRYGYNPLQVTAFGCTSRGQAHRFGKWALYSELSETETCTHRVGLEGKVALPGQLYKVLDSSRSGVRFGGRLISATTTGCVLDAPVTFEDGKSYTISFVVLSDPPALSTVEVASSVTGTTTEVTFKTALEAAPDPMAVWVLESPDYIEAQLFRCVAVNEVETCKFEIIGIEHNPGKFDLVEYGVAFDEPPISGQLPADTIIAPTGVRFTEEDRVNSVGVMERHLYLSWDIVPQTCIAGYDAEYSINGGSWITLSAGEQNKAEILSPVTGNYQGRVRSRNIFGAPSEWVVTSFSVSARSDAAPDVTGLQLLGQGNDTIFLDRDARFSWKQPVPGNAVVDQLADDSFGVGTPYPTGWLDCYEITVYNDDAPAGVPGALGTVRRTDKASSEEYSYTYDKNSLDGNGVPVRNFTITVAARTVWGSVSANPARLSVSNPAPAMLT